MLGQFRVTIPGYFQFQSIITRKLINFRVTIPGNCTISGYCQKSHATVPLKKIILKIRRNPNVIGNQVAPRRREVG